MSEDETFINDEQEAEVNEPRTSLTLKVKLLNTLCDIVENGVKKVTKDGDVVELTADASYINAAVNYLKTFPPEEEPEAAAREKSDTLQKYADKMPFKPRVVR